MQTKLTPQLRFRFMLIIRLDSMAAFHLLECLPDTDCLPSTTSKVTLVRSALLPSAQATGYEAVLTTSSLIAAHRSAIGAAQALDRSDTDSRSSLD
jgi:hypothetical protein